MPNLSLTKKEFWTKTWANHKLPIKLDSQIRADRSFINIFNKYLDNSDNKQKTCIEIGCIPGKFLIYFAEFLNYEISGIDYNEAGVELTKRNISEMGLEANIIEKDIFNFRIEKQFDAVLSFGFIEHFKKEKLEEALAIHVNLLKKNGLLFLSVPNFRYLNYVFAYFFRNDMLPLHNLETMDKEFFRNLSRKYNLEIQYLDYFGGIHPGGLKIGRGNIFGKFFSKYIVDKTEAIFLLDHINSKYFSHHVGAVLKKN